MPSADVYRARLLDMLPRGRAWSRRVDGGFYKLADGMAQELARLDTRLRAALDNAIPDTIDADMIGDWEQAFGVPEFQPAPTELADRRAAIIQKMILERTLAPSVFVALAARAGHTAYVERLRLSGCGGLTCGQMIFNSSWVYVWRAVLLTAWAGTDAATLLEAVMSDYQPADGRFVFDAPLYPFRSYFSDESWDIYAEPCGVMAVGELVRQHVTVTADGAVPTLCRVAGNIDPNIDADIQDNFTGANGTHVENAGRVAPLNVPGSDWITVDGVYCEINGNAMRAATTDPTCDVIEATQRPSRISGTMTLTAAAPTKYTGIVFRHDGTAGYDCHAVVALNGVWTLATMSAAGVFAVLDTSDTVATAAAHTVEIRDDGSHIAVYIDDVLELGADDDTNAARRFVGYCANVSLDKIDTFTVKIGDPLGANSLAAAMGGMTAGETATIAMRSELAAALGTTQSARAWFRPTLGGGASELDGFVIVRGGANGVAGAYLVCVRFSAASSTRSITIGRADSGGFAVLASGALAFRDTFDEPTGVQLRVADGTGGDIDIQVLTNDGDGWTEYYAATDTDGDELFGDAGVAAVRVGQSDGATVDPDDVMTIGGMILGNTAPD